MKDVKEQALFEQIYLPNGESHLVHTLICWEKHPASFGYHSISPLLKDLVTTPQPAELLVLSKRGQLYLLLDDIYWPFWSLWVRFFYYFIIFYFEGEPR